MTHHDRKQPNRFSKPVPSLPVKSCDETVRYYCDVLGFEKDFDDDMLEYEVMMFAGVSRGDFAITLNQHDEQDYRATIGCDVENVDKLYEEFSAKNVKIVVPPCDEPWGMRHMSIADLDGHQLHFQSPIID